MKTSRLILVTMMALLLAGGAMAQSASYDAADRLTLVRYDATNMIHYVYDSAGNLTKVVAIGADWPDFDSNTNGIPDRYELTWLGELSPSVYSFEAGFAPKGTPNWWLALYGYTNGLAAAELADLDGDGVANWLEYRAGTDPRAALLRPEFNVVPYAESFENLAGWGGVYTNVFPRMGWFSGDAAQDRSRLVKLAYAFGGQRPLPTATHTNVLQLDAFNTALTNSFGAGFDMGGAVTRIDLMMRFVPCDERPGHFTVEDTGVKCGTYADVSNRLAVYHGVANPDGSLLSNTVSATVTVLEPAAWHRVTLAVDATATNVALFQAQIDGVTVTNASAYAEGWKAQFRATGQLPPTSASGTWFRLATTNLTSRLLTGVCFTGSGYADDLTVTPDPKMFLLSVVKSGNGRSSLGTAPFQSLEVQEGAETQVVYTAQDWHRIAALTANGSDVQAAAGAKAYTQAFANVSSDLSNNVSFAEALPVQTGFGAVPTAWLMNWSEAAVCAGDGDPFDVASEYLLGLSPVSDNTFGLEIESVHLADGEVVTVVRRALTGGLSPDGMHGTLRLQAAERLGGAFTNVAGTAITGASAFGGDNRRTYTNAVEGAGRFFRAVIE